MILKLISPPHYHRRQREVATNLRLRCLLTKVRSLIHKKAWVSFQRAALQLITQEAQSLPTLVTQAQQRESSTIGEALVLVSNLALFSPSPTRVTAPRAQRNQRGCSWLGASARIFLHLIAIACLVAATVLKYRKKAVMMSAAKNMPQFLKGNISLKAVHPYCLEEDASQLTVRYLSWLTS
jgi:hypothetical protein